MFEKEAEEYLKKDGTETEKMLNNITLSLTSRQAFVLKNAFKQTFKDGAEFGYNKAIDKAQTMQTDPAEPREFWRLIVKRFLHKRKHHAVDHCRSLQKQKTHATARNGNNANETAEILRAVNETAETLRTVLCELQILLCKNKYFTLLKPAETETARNATAARKPYTTKPPETQRNRTNRPKRIS